MENRKICQCDGHSTNISACRVSGVEGKGHGSSLQEIASHIHTFRLS